MPNQEYIVTVRKASRDGKDAIIAHEAGVDMLLTTNSKGRLVLPDDLFQQAKKLLNDATS